MPPTSQLYLDWPPIGLVHLLKPEVRLLPGHVLAPVDDLGSMLGQIVPIHHPKLHNDAYFANADGVHHFAVCFPGDIFTQQISSVSAKSWYMSNMFPYRLEFDNIATICIWLYLRKSTKGPKKAGSVCKGVRHQYMARKEGTNTGVSATSLHFPNNREGKTSVAATEAKVGLTMFSRE